MSTPFLQIPSGAEQRLGMEIDSKLTKWKRYRATLDATAETNLSYYYGYHWNYYSKDLLRLTSPNPELVPKWKVFYVANFVFSRLQTIYNILVKSRPSVGVVPAVASARARDAAKVAEKVLKYEWKAEDMQGALNQAVLAALIMPVSYLKVEWDELKRRTFLEARLSPITGQPELNPEGEQQYIARQLADASWKYVNFFDLYVHPATTEWRNCRELVQTETMHVEDARERYNKENIEADANISVATERIKEFYELTDSPERLEDHVVLKHWYQRPTKKHPNGRHVTLAGINILEDGPLPDGDLPFVSIQFLPLPLQFEGITYADMIRDLNTQYNKRRSQIIEGIRLNTNPKWLDPRGSDIPAGSPSNMPDEVIPYNMGYKPEVVSMPPIPQYALDNIQRIVNDIDETLGLYAPARGEVPGSLRTGRAIAYLQERSLERFSDSMRIVDEAIVAWGKKTLKMIVTRWKESRLISVCGEGMQPEVVEFRGSDLAEGFDVIIESSSGLMQSKALQQDFVMTLYQGGLIKDERGQPDFKRALTMMGVGGLEGVWENEMVQRQAAKLENLTIEQDREPLVTRRENHDVHIQEHAERQEILKMRGVPDDILVKFEQHIIVHENTKQELITTEIKKAAALKQEISGGPRPPPTGLDIPTGESEDMIGGASEAGKEKMP